MTNEGSSPQAWSATVVIDVVVVFPWVPATATALESAMSEASAPERWMIRAPRARGDEFRVVLADRRGDDEGVGLAEVVGGVADLDAGSERTEDVDDGGLLRVRSRHAHPVHRHDPGDPGHARASDADEVDGSEFGDGDDLSCAHGQPLRAEVVIWAIVAAASVG